MSSEDNLDPVLKKHLGRVEAPANLWNHVRGHVAIRRTWVSWGAWATVAAALVVSAGGWTLLQQLRTPQSMEAQAVAALNQGARDLGLQTESAGEVRNWVKKSSGIDIPLPPKHTAMVRIIGASITTDRNPIAQVSYQVGEYRAALLVTKDPTGKTTYPHHEARDSDPYETARVSSWSMKGQSYTLAWSAPGEARVACLLCHGTEPAVGVSPNLMN